ncbi:recombinase family protein [Phenylobacterium sp.]|uniref:recombinase family protein n=1 Tax=Phenylobacterium sp. TaxID=1871053 RepID=UPI00122A0E5C|nr:recombinase family protein [Phenylobacterium sp.]THD61624.1 MAG: recombinase family protein [Phenylobacterium sp.]
MRAAQYVRMSTERQDFSPDVQMATNAAYALERGYSLVQTYSDEGVSGLGIEKRAGLQRLIADVVSGDPGFDVILVYDVSRWGRFQNPDQAAHYEFLCREAGVMVEYTVEPFENNDTMTASLIKHIKRAMAAEYSRDLSAKTRRAQAHLRGLGYWMGGEPGYGLRRQSVTRSGKALGTLEAGQVTQWTQRGRARTVLIWGPSEEVEAVRRIYRLFLARRSFDAITANLATEGLTAECGRPWTHAALRGILRNEKYAGTHVLGKQRCVLGKVSKEPQANWLRVPTSFPPIVSRRTFRAAQKEFSRRRRPIERQALIDDLQRVLQSEGRLSQAIIDKSSRYSSQAYLRFGGLLETYQLVGYVPPERAVQGQSAARVRFSGLGSWPHVSDEEVIARLQRLLEREGKLTIRAIVREPDIPPIEVCRRRFGDLEHLYALAGYTPAPGQLNKMRTWQARRSAGSRNQAVRPTE